MLILLNLQEPVSFENKLKFVIHFYRIKNAKKVENILHNAMETYYKAAADYKQLVKMEQSVYEICNEINTFLTNKESSNWSDEKKKVERQYINEVIQTYFASSPTKGGLGTQLPAKEFNNDK